MPRFAYGNVDFLDPKILLSVLMWAVYLLMVYTRLECRMARPPRCHARQRRFRHRDRRLDRQLLQRNAQVHRLMRFQLIGVNHKTAPVEVRERLAIPESRLPDACKKLAEHPAVAEGMIVSTCNRVEFIANMKNGTGDLREFMGEYFQLDPAEFESHLYEFREDEAIRHIFRVASSLDSMVVGEPQILGQVKEAYATARAVGAVRAQLDQLLTRAFAVAKRVRTETAVGSSSVSIASVAVELAQENLWHSQRQEASISSGQGR